MAEEGGGFDRVNLDEVALEQTVAHGGDGTIGVARVANAGELAGPCNFVDLAVVPPGRSIGRHAHRPDEEELYLVLSGEGTMWRDGEEFPVRPGDLVRNRPGGTHGLVNTGAESLRLFVIELHVDASPEDTSTVHASALRGVTG